MTNLKLKCVYPIEGFTLEKEYPVLANGVNVVVVKDDFGNTMSFNKAEGVGDFKNYFIMVRKIA